MKKKPIAKKPAKPRARKPAPRKPARIAAKPDGDAAVLAYIARLPAEQRAIALVLDRIVRKQVKRLQRAVKWNVPFYGVEGNGWFCAFAAFKRHTSVSFFRGVQLDPPPSDGGVQQARRVVYRSLADVDEAQLTSWVRQAAAIPGWLAPR